MTPLAEKIRNLIQQTGPLKISDYFSLCLADPDHGYYQSREPFGQTGDFITAPEISQLFGEMIGVFLVQAWHAQGALKTPGSSRSDLDAEPSCPTRCG
jgi:SAM-dependent MidA family methyltransferase